MCRGQLERDDASLAGPATIIAWLIGGGAMMLLSLTHAELGAAYPMAAGNAHFPHYAVGGLVGFTSGWVASSEPSRSG